MDHRVATLIRRASPYLHRFRNMAGLVVLVVMSIALSPRTDDESEIHCVAGSKFSEDDWFSVADGTTRVIFEFDIVEDGTGHTTTDDGVRTKIHPTDSPADIARALAAAVNTAQRHHGLKVEAVADGRIIRLEGLEDEELSVRTKTTPLEHGTKITFLGGENLTNIVRQVSEIGIMALAMTFVILSAGIDLSVGSVLALSASIVATVLAKWSPEMGTTGHILIAMAAAILAAGAAGAINGIVIATLRIQPFIVTLAAMIGIRGLAKWLTDNANIGIGFGNNVPAIFADFVATKLFVIGAFLCLTIAFAMLLSRTVLGRYVRALGDNPTAALYSGLPIKRLQILVYTLSGLLAGVAGVLHAAQTRQGSPNAGGAYELDVIAAVVIGGTSLAGGKGTIFGTIVGTLIMGVLTNILGLNNVDDNVQRMIKAVIIIAAVYLQRTDRQ